MSVLERFMIQIRGEIYMSTFGGCYAGRWTVRMTKANAHCNVANYKLAVTRAVAMKDWGVFCLRRSQDSITHQQYVSLNFHNYSHPIFNSLYKSERSILL